MFDAVRTPVDSLLLLLRRFRLHHLYPRASGQLKQTISVALYRLMEAVFVTGNGNFQKRSLTIVSYLLLFHSPFIPGTAFIRFVNILYLYLRLFM